jgi:threonine dehydrogenase-like Zn-dependent dehydrogenase
MSELKNNVFRGIEGVVKKVPVEIAQELGPKEILLKITHSGLCGTDVHYIPHSAALGHEGVGIVEKIGSDVTQFKIGDRAGAGYLRNVYFTHCSSAILTSFTLLILCNSHVGTANIVSQVKTSGAMSVIFTARETSRQVHLLTTSSARRHIYTR